MNGDEPRGMRRRDIQKVRERELKLLRADGSNGQRWLVGAGVVFLGFAGLLTLLVLLRV